MKIAVPVLATASSFFLAPLGIEGWLLQMCTEQPESIRSFGMYASIAKYVLAVLIILVSIVITTVDEEERESSHILIVLIVLLVLVSIAALINSGRSIFHGKCL